MYSRFNDHRYGLPDGQPPFLTEPHTFTRLSSQASSNASKAQAGGQRNADPAGALPHVPHTLEHEIPEIELNGFSLACLEQLCSSPQHSKLEELLSTLIMEHLPSYLDLKKDFRDSREEHQSHHRWTQQMYHAVEPLISQKTGPITEQRTLGELAVKCVEQDLQLHYRVQQLGSRISFLERAVPQHLIGVGKQLGLPEKVMSKLGKLLRVAMKNSG
ncbi:MAG: hypothetical protein ACPH5P_05910 [Akkermansiaceae bacterium]